MVSKLTTPEERASILRAQLSGNAPTKTNAKKVDGPPLPLFTAGFHAAARLSKGLPLSPLEQRLIETLKVFASDDEIKQYGNIYTEMKDTARSLSGDSIFSASVLNLDETVSYTDEDLLHDALQATPELLAMPSNAIVDISTADEGECIDSTEYIAALSNYGSGVTVFTGPEKPANSTESAEVLQTTDAETTTIEQATDNETATASGPYYRMMFDRFKCHKKQSDSVTGPKNEIYWCMASGADSYAEKSSKTKEYGSIVNGSVRAFDGVEYFSGGVQKHLAGHIECWEADDSGSGFYSKMIQTMKDIATWSIDAAVNATNSEDWGDSSGNTGSGAAILALVAIVGGLVGKLIEFFLNDDDLVHRRDIAFTQSGLEALLQRPNHELSLMFDGGSQGKHELWIRTTRIAGPPGTLQALKMSPSGGWTGASCPMGSSPHGMTMAVHLNALVGVFRQSNNTVYWSKYSNNSWSAPRPIAGVTSLSRPALAAFNQKLFCLYRDTSNLIRCTSVTGDLNSWTSPISVAGGATIDGPSLAGYNGKLISIVRGTDNNLYWNESNGTTWTNYAGFTWATQGSPALCAYNNALECAIYAMNGGMYFNALRNGRWGGFGKVEGSINAGPALANFNGKMWVTQRGTDQNGLWFMSYDGNTGRWTPNMRFVDLYCAGEQGLCEFQGSLWCVFGVK